MKKHFILLLVVISLMAFTGCSKNDENEGGTTPENIDYTLLSSYYELSNFVWGESKEALKAKQTTKLVDEGKSGDDYYFVRYETGKIGAKLLYFFNKKGELDQIGLEDIDGKYGSALFDLMKEKYGTPTPLNKSRYEFIYKGSRIYHEIFGAGLLSIWLEPEVKAIDSFYKEPLKSWVATKEDVKAFEKRTLLSESSDGLKYIGSKRETEVGYFFNKSGTVERGYVILPGNLNSAILAALESGYGKPIYDKITRDYLYSWQRDVLFRINGLDVYYCEYEDQGRHITVYYSWQDRWVIKDMAPKI